MTIINAGTKFPVLDGPHAGQVFTVEHNVMRGNTIEAVDDGGHRHLIEPEDGWNKLARPDAAADKMLYRLACLVELPFPQHFFLYRRRKDGKPIDLNTVELSPDGKVIFKGDSSSTPIEPVDADFEVVEPTAKLAPPEPKPAPKPAPKKGGTGFLGKDKRKDGKSRR